MSQKMISCKACGKEIAASAKACPECGAKNKKPIYKKWWLWVIVAVVLIAAVSGGGNDNESTNATVAPADQAAETQSTTAPAPSAFDGDCGIAASAEMGSSIIGLPQLTISVKNTTEKEIAAVQFYAVPCNVYGEEITGWTSQNKLYTDTAIAPGKSTSIEYQFIEDSVKTVKLYVYSVYYADGTEWGNRDATKSTILKQGALIEVSGNS